MSDSWFSNDVIVSRILSRLSLAEMFSAQGVCHFWKQVSGSCIRQQKSIVITEEEMWNVDLSRYDCEAFHECMGHPAKYNNIVSQLMTDLNFWINTLDMMPHLEVVYFRLWNVEGNRLEWDKYSKVLEIVMRKTCQTLVCLNLSEYSEDRDDPFPFVHHLPRLKHFIMWKMSPFTVNNLIKAAVNLEFFEGYTSFTQWNLLPRRFKELHSPEGSRFDMENRGMTNFLLSSAVSSIESILSMKIEKGIVTNNYHLPCLKALEVKIERDTDWCLNLLAGITRQSPVLDFLSILITAQEEISLGVWTRALSNCCNVTELRIEIPFVGNIRVDSWQDQVAESMGKHMKNLDEAHLDFPLSSKGLRELCSLHHLRSFHHRINTRNMQHKDVFDTDALVEFLETHASRKLHSYSLHGWDEYVSLKKSFLDDVKRMEQMYSLNISVLQSRDHLSSHLLSTIFVDTICISKKPI